jgi:GNAT superfamily N-acetyltransferase
MPDPAPTPPTVPALHLRPATEADVDAIVGLIRELAEFEHLTHLLEVTPAGLREQLFGARPAAECLVAQLAAGDAAPEPDAPIIAFALYFPTFSTFLGRPGLWLEDLYVQPAHRGSGVGRALLQRVGAIAQARGCGRLEWSVLDWNERAIGFYRGMGATVMPDWRICRVTGPALAALGGERPSSVAPAMQAPSAPAA